MNQSKILVVEDDNTLREVLKYNLQKEGYEVLVASDGEAALDVARQSHPDLVILDLMLPIMSGLDVCRILHGERNTPIIMLTAKSEEIDKVLGLELGADDYITKPFSMRELIARIKAILRRVPQTKQRNIKSLVGKSQSITAGNIKIDMVRHQVFKDINLIELSPKEFDLMVFLMSNRGQVFSRDQILQEVWGYDYIGNSRTVDVHMRCLRQKIENDLDHPQYLLTVRGYGYKFTD
jgi:DNA-binding response OmpR family regulator